MLTPTQMNQFRTRGFTVAEDLLDDETLAQIRAEYEALLDDLYQGWMDEGLVPEMARGGFWEKLVICNREGFEWYQPFDISLPHSDITEETPFHTGPAVFDMITHPRILDMIEQLIGGEITSNPIQHVRIKPPASAIAPSEKRAHITATDWHQDLGVTLKEADETEFVTVWLAITDATIENGCLQIAPGRYAEILPHCSKNQVGIADPFIPRDRAIPVPIKAGSAIVFSPLTPHASLSNTSDEFRWSFDLRYNVSGQATGRSQFPEFIARSLSNPGSELRDWRAWRDLWESCRRSLAEAPHVPQHRWNSDSPYCA